MNFFKKIIWWKRKVYKATITSTGETFKVPRDINLLQAALKAGIKWPYSCRVGLCGTCRCTVTKGKIKRLNDFSYALDKEQRKSRMILACQSRLKTDAIVEVDFDQKALH